MAAPNAKASQEFNWDTSKAVMNSALGTNSMWETSVEFLMVANPDPNPYIVLSEGNRSIVQCHTHRPGAPIKAQPFQMQAGVCWILSKPLIGLGRAASFMGAGNWPYSSQKWDVALEITTSVQNRLLGSRGKPQDCDGTQIRFGLRVQ